MRKGVSWSNRCGTQVEQRAYSPEAACWALKACLNAVAKALALAWDGFMRTAIMASEMRDPRRTIPFSILGGIAIAAIVFFAVATVTLGVLGGENNEGPMRSARTMTGKMGRLSRDAQAIMRPTLYWPVLSRHKDNAPQNVWFRTDAGDLAC